MKRNALPALLACLFLCACSARPGGAPAAAPEPPEPEASKPAVETEEIEEEEPSPYDEILLGFGAEYTDNPLAMAPLQISPVSFFYLDDAADLSALPPDSYYSWYMRLASQQDWAGSETGRYPQDEYERRVAQAFGVDAQTLRTGSAYLADEACYHLDGAGGIGMRPFIALDRAEPDGDNLNLYLTLIPNIYSSQYSNEYKILTVLLREDGSCQYQSYVTDSKPSESQQAAGQRDYTTVSTGQPARYENAELGFAVQFPDNWAEHYTVEESHTDDGPFLQFCYAGDASASLALITGIPREAFEDTDGVKLGETGRYIFTGGGSWDCPYPDGPDKALFEELSITAEELAGMFETLE